LLSLARFVLLLSFGFKALTAVRRKMAVVWVVAPCRLVEVSDVSEVLGALLTRASRTSEKIANF
jgi:hypothetical protein